MKVIELLLPQVLALATGSFVAWAAFRRMPHAWMGIAGYGYLIGLVLAALGLYVAGITGLGVRFAYAAAIQAAVAIVLGLAILRFTRGTLISQEAPVIGLRGAARAVVALVLVLVLARAVAAGIEAVTLPLYPWDAWQQWATKARVWLETGRLMPFVSASAWLGAPAGATLYTDANPSYPPLVPLIEVWTLGPSATWNDASIGISWIGLYGALALGFTWQVRRLLQWWPFALVAAYLLLSMPFLDTHVALQGYADLPLAVLYCFAFMAATSFHRFGRQGDAAIALVLVATLPFFKRPGIAWALTLLPFAVVLLPPARRTLLLRVMVVGGALAAAALIAYRLSGVPLADIANSVWSLVLNLFAWDNWHLLWYVALPVVFGFGWRESAPGVAAARASMALGVAFLAAAFWGTALYASIADVTTLNRALLPYACTLCYFLALLLAPRVEPLAVVQPAPAARTQDVSA